MVEYYNGGGRTLCWQARGRQVLLRCHPSGATAEKSARPLFIARRRNSRRSPRKLRSEIYLRSARFGKCSEVSQTRKHEIDLRLFAPSSFQRWRSWCVFVPTSTSIDAKAKGRRSPFTGVPWVIARIRNPPKSASNPLWSHQQGKGLGFEKKLLVNSNDPNRGSALESANRYSHDGEPRQARCRKTGELEPPAQARRLCTNAQQ